MNKAAIPGADMEERGDFCPGAGEQFLLRGEKEEVVGGAHSQMLEVGCSQVSLSFWEC